MDLFEGQRHRKKESGRKQSVREGREEGEPETFYLLSHPSNAYKSKQTRPMPGDRNSIWVYHVSDKDTSTWTIMVQTMTETAFFAQRTFTYNCFALFMFTP